MRFYLNRSGLRGALQTYSSTLTPLDLERLMVSFAKNSRNWDIVDSGPGDDKADELIKSTYSGLRPGRILVD